MAGTIYGYIRVSTREQNEDRQRLALAALPVPEENIYMDKQSGKDFERPQYRRLVRRLRRDSGTVADAHQGKGRGHRRTGHAPSGHPARQGFDGHLSQRHCAPGALLRGGKRARQHPPAAGGGYRGSQGPGRTLWPPSPSPPRQFPHAPSGLAGPKNNTPTGGQGLRNAHRDLLFQGNKTGNTGLNKWRYFRKFENLYFFKNLTLSPYFRICCVFYKKSISSNKLFKS